MTDELSLKKTIRLQSEINRYLRDTLAKVKERSQRSLDYCKRNNLNPSHSAEDISEMCEVALAKLDSQYSRLEHIKKGTLKGQTKLEDE